MSARNGRPCSRFCARATLRTARDGRSPPRAAAQTEVGDALAVMAAEPDSPIAELIDFRTAGPGTLPRIFARAEAILCTEDSSTMLSEAVCARLPVVGVSPRTAWLQGRGTGVSRVHARRRLVPLPAAGRAHARSDLWRSWVRSSRWPRTTSTGWLQLCASAATAVSIDQGVCLQQSHAVTQAHAGECGDIIERQRPYGARNKLIRPGPQAIRTRCSARHRRRTPPAPNAASAAGALPCSGRRKRDSPSSARPRRRSAASATSDPQSGCREVGRGRQSSRRGSGSRA